MGQESSFYMPMASDGNGHRDGDPEAIFGVVAGIVAGARDPSRQSPHLPMLYDAGLSLLKTQSGRGRLSSHRSATNTTASQCRCKPGRRFTARSSYAATRAFPLSSSGFHKSVVFGFCQPLSLFGGVSRIEG